MHAAYPGEGATVAHRVLWLYGIYMLLSNAAYVAGYALLPEGVMRQSPSVAAGRIVAGASSFWGELGLTLLFNVGLVVVVALIMNLNQVRGFPVGYLYPIVLGVVSGLISGTNSFASSDLTQFNARDGMALGLSIGNLEMLGYILMLAATVRYGVYQYRSWWRWSGEWSPTKRMQIRDVRLTRSEWLALGLGLACIILAGVRETVMARGGLP
jgi:hypothetical protein